MTKQDKNLKTQNRVGVIDVGSNSVRLVVFDGASRSPAYFFNEKVLCGLGEDLAKTGKLHPEGKERALKALHRFKAIAERLDLDSLGAVATEAVRAASDGRQFCDQVNKEVGIELVPILGEQEAHLSANGVLLGWPKASGLVCDIGGASMELAELSIGEIEIAKSSKLGPMAVMGKYGQPENRLNYLRGEISKLLRNFSPNPETLFLVGGAFRAIARIHMKLNKYPFQVLHDYCVHSKDLLKTLEKIKVFTPEELTEYLDGRSTRVKYIPLVAETLTLLIKGVEPKEISFSSYGLREGLLYNSMPAEIRELDPLVEAARAMEAVQARFPGFGDQLNEWLRPLFGSLGASPRRLIHAACLLHDVHWRDHPDYRADVCFGSAMHASLGGVDHKGRIFLAWALFNRYKPNRLSANYTRVNEILSAEQMQWAETVGYAIRLGAMMSGSDPKKMGTLKISDLTVHLELNEGSKNMFGEVVMKRLEKLASSLGRKPVVSYV